jgi:hypothetical protein
MRPRNKVLARLKRSEWQPLPPSLEKAFEAVEKTQPVDLAATERKNQ